MIGIVAVLITLLLPSIRRARLSSQKLKAHADLRSVDIALGMYAQDFRKALPPTRFSCQGVVDYELPAELGDHGYLPRDASGTRRARLLDVFADGASYRYRAPGPAIINGFTLVPRGADLFVPDDFPACQSTQGTYSSDPATSRVKYALWSTGTLAAPESLPMPIGRAPLPAVFWWGGPSGDKGLITHFQASSGQFGQSP